MSDVKTRSLWQVLDAQWIDTDPECDVIAVALRGNGTEYTITCAGPRGMKSNEFITALRAGTAALIRTVGGDMSIVGGADPKDATFDTGDQRAN
jgi:hypothetical protein